MQHSANSMTKLNHGWEQGGEGWEGIPKRYNLVYTYFIATDYNNGIGSQVLKTLATILPLHIQINKSYKSYL